MAAVMKVYELTASMAGVNKTNATVRFKDANSTIVDTNDPITIPGAGTNRSFTKHVRFYCATAPDTQIDNLKLYTDGSGFGAGVKVVASNTASLVTATRDAITGATNLFLFDSGSNFINVDEYHTSAVTATGFCGDVIQLQLEATPAASSGTLSAETLTFAYDEI